MSVLDRNKIFFGLLHYIFSEQHNVDWAFKTSLVNFTGINTSVDNSKYKKVDLTDSILDYIYDVKPYHVQFEQYIEKYSSQQETANVEVTERNDIEIDVRFDAVTTEVDEQGSMSDLEYMDTHMANRLYLTKTHDKDVIKDYLNAHFKGITVSGGSFNMDKSGYDAFLYDTKLYDAPTITHTYCLVNYNEPYNYPYNKKFISVGVKFLNIDDEEIIDNSHIKIYSEFNGIKEEITDYSMENNVITLFYSLRKFEKISVLYKNGDVQKAYIFVSYPFYEDNDENSLRKFVDCNTRRFTIPNSEMVSNKIIVQLQNKDGTRIPTNGYDIDGNDIIIYDNQLGEDWQVQITVVDYQFIYDKIYHWEDVYGQYNNLPSLDDYDENMPEMVNLDGNSFLRPHYEKDRPSELSVIQPLTYLMIEEYNGKNKLKSIYNVDYKNKQFKLNISQSTKLLKDLNIGDDKIYVINGDKLRLPYKEKDVLYPAKIIINNEIIAFYDYEKINESEYILKKIKRAWGGSYLNPNHKKDDMVIVYNDEIVEKINNLSLSYEVNDENKFIIPGNFGNNENIEVWRKPIIKLLSNITFEGDSFLISSNNVELPKENKKGYLYINDDKIYFDKIEYYKENMYKVSGYNIDKEYFVDDSYILSKSYIQETNYKIDSEEYFVEEYNENNEKQEYSKKKNFVVLDVAPEPHEIITVINRT